MMIMTLFGANGLWWFIPQFCRHACHILVRFHRTSFLFNFSENMFLFFFLLSFPKIFPFSSNFTLLSTLFHCSRYMSCALHTLYNCFLCAIQVFLRPLLMSYTVFYQFYSLLPSTVTFGILRLASVSLGSIPRLECQPRKIQTLYGLFI